ncbi:MAG: phenylalanine--tRNA ligase subunit alpha, partial [Clostridia bacterium]
MKEQIAKIVEACLLEINNSSDLGQINNAKVKYLGKSGEFTTILRGMKDVSVADKPMVGKLINDARVKLEDAFFNKEKQIDADILAQKLKNEKIDISID